MLGPNEGFAGFWEIVATADFIVTRGYRVITLQFPDSLLKDATLVQAALARECQSKGGHRIEACLAPPPSLNVSCVGSDGEFEVRNVMQAFVMADTTYNSVGVDEVAAQHVDAQCVVSLSPCQSLSQVTVYRAHTFCAFLLPAAGA